MAEMSITEFNQLLREKNLKIACAESITAGLLASTIASVPGASDVLKGSIVTYNIDMKMALLGVRKETLKINSPESIETSQEMVAGLIKLYPFSDIYVAVTGVASPSTLNYQVKKNVGDVFVCISYQNETTDFNINIKSDNRNEIREAAVKFIISCIVSLLK